MPRLTDPDLDLNSLFEISVEQPKMKKEASASKLKFAEHKDKFAHVGFDLYSNDSNEIWKLETDAASGEEFIIRTAQYDTTFKASRVWTAELNQNKTAITLAYKGTAIKAFKKAEVQFDDENADDWRKFLVDKIKTDPSFVETVLAEVGSNRRDYILGKFPELKK